MPSYRHRYHLVDAAHWDRPLPDYTLDFEAVSDEAALARIEQERLALAARPNFEGISDESLFSGSREIQLPTFSHTA